MRGVYAGVFAVGWRGRVGRWEGADGELVEGVCGVGGTATDVARGVVVHDLLTEVFGCDGGPRGALLAETVFAG
jgi:hypothetical protein